LVFWNRMGRWLRGRRLGSGRGYLKHFLRHIALGRVRRPLDLGMSRLGNGPLQGLGIGRRERRCLVGFFLDDFLPAEGEARLDESESHAQSYAAAGSGVAVSLVPSLPVTTVSTISPGVPPGMATSVKPSVRPRPSRSTSTRWTLPRRESRCR